MALCQAQPPKPIITKATDAHTKTAIFARADHYCSTHIEHECENKFCIAYCDHKSEQSKGGTDEKKRALKECESWCTPDKLCSTEGEENILANVLTRQIRAMQTTCLHEMVQKLDPKNAPPPPPPPPEPKDPYEDMTPQEAGEKEAEEAKKEKEDTQKAEEAKKKEKDERLQKKKEERKKERAAKGLTEESDEEAIEEEEEEAPKKEPPPPDPGDPEGQNWYHFRTEEWKKSGIKLPHEIPEGEPEYGADF